jgi:uncharacterized membrane protein
VFLIQLALSFRGIDSKNSQKDEFYQVLTLRNVIGFFMVFGWSGLACLDSGLSDDATIIASFFCGIVMMFVMATVFYLMGKIMKSVKEGLE